MVVGAVSLLIARTVSHTPDCPITGPKWDSLAEPLARRDKPLMRQPLRRREPGSDQAAFLRRLPFAGGVAGWGSALTGSERRFCPRPNCLASSDRAAA
jgi:hypothetical protein